MGSCVNSIRSIFAVLLVLVFAIPVQSQIHVGYEFPRPRGFVNDYEGLLSREQVLSLDSLLRAFERRTSHEIVVVCISQFSPYETLFDYSLDMFLQWGIGKNEEENGLLLLVCRKQNAVEIQAGVGLSEKLDSISAQQIISRLIVSEFEKDKICIGIRDGVAAIIDKIDQTNNN